MGIIGLTLDVVSVFAVTVWLVWLAYDGLREGYRTQRIMSELRLR